jgi:SAM-dependent methyltransferase
MLLDSCASDNSVSLSIQYLKGHNQTILEAGCGSGRVVKYLYDMGFKNIYGIELNGAAYN